MAAAVEENRRVLTPLWYELLEEAKKDGSIQTDYTRELSELLPLINFWLMPSVYPATAEEVRHKYRFIIKVLSAMGLPLMDDEMTAIAENFLANISIGGSNMKTLIRVQKMNTFIIKEPDAQTQSR